MNFTQARSIRVDRKGLRRRRQGNLQIVTAADGVYPAGGFPLAASTFGLRQIEECVADPAAAASGFLTGWDAATDKLLILRQNGATGPLVEPVGVDLNGTTFRVSVQGS